MKTAVVFFPGGNKYTQIKQLQVVLREEGEKVAFLCKDYDQLDRFVEKILVPKRIRKLVLLHEDRNIDRFESAAHYEYDHLFENVEVLIDFSKERRLYEGPLGSGNSNNLQSSGGIVSPATVQTKGTDKPGFKTIIIYPYNAPVKDAESNQNFIDAIKDITADQNTNSASTDTTDTTDTKKLSPEEVIQADPMLNNMINYMYQRVGVSSIEELAEKINFINFIQSFNMNPTLAFTQLMQTVQRMGNNSNISSNDIENAVNQAQEKQKQKNVQLGNNVIIVTTSTIGCEQDGYWGMTAPSVWSLIQDKGPIIDVDCVFARTFEGLQRAYTDSKVNKPGDINNNMITKVYCTPDFLNSTFFTHGSKAWNGATQMTIDTTRIGNGTPRNLSMKAFEYGSEIIKGANINKNQIQYWRNPSRINKTKFLIKVLADIDYAVKHKGKDEVRKDSNEKLKDFIMNGLGVGKDIDKAVEIGNNAGYGILIKAVGELLKNKDESEDISAEDKYISHKLWPKFADCFHDENMFIEAEEGGGMK